MSEIEVQEKQYEHFVGADFPKEETQAEFVVDDMSKANWCLKKIARLQRDTACAEKYVKQEIERLEAWLTTKRQQNDKNIAFFEYKLRPFAAAQLEGSKMKTLDLPDGTCSFKKQGPKFEKNDTELLAYLERNNETAFIEIKRVPKWGDFKKTLKVTDDGRAVTQEGEPLDFIRVIVPDEDAFSVKIKEGK